jgi:hypothetical protein
LNIDEFSLSFIVFINTAFYTKLVLSYTNAFYDNLGLLTILYPNPLAKFLSAVVEGQILPLSDSTWFYLTSFV